MIRMSDTPFGTYKNTDERLSELMNRLTAWYISGEQLPELFSVAQQKMAGWLNTMDPLEVLEASPDLFLEAFEEALTDYDNLLAQFPEEEGDELG